MKIYILSGCFSSTTDILEGNYMYKQIMNFILLFILSSSPAFTAENPDWEGFPSLVNIKRLAAYDGKIYGVTSAGIVIYDPASDSYELLYKNHGLEYNDILTVCSSGDNIYFGFRNDGLMSYDKTDKSFKPVLFPEYVNKEDVQKTISVNDIFALNDSILYVAHSKGIDMLNMNTEEIKTYSRLSPGIKEDTPVNKVNIFKNKIWACTDVGLAWAEINNPNLEFAENWDSFDFGSRVNCILSYVSSSLDMIYVGTQNNISSFDYEKKIAIRRDYNDKNLQVYDFSISGGVAYAATNAGIFYKAHLTWYKRETDPVLPFSLLSTDDNSDSLWIGTLDSGIKCFVNNKFADIPKINCPRSQTIRSIEITPQNTVWAATSMRDAGGFVLRYMDGLWNDYSTLDGIPGSLLPARNYETSTNSIFLDGSGRLWFGTWGYGVYVLDDKGTIEKTDDKITRIDPEMKVILPYTEGSNFVVNRSITQDNKGNIWITGWSRGVFVIDSNYEVGKPITDYQSIKYTFDENVDFVWKVFADNEGWIWLGTSRSGIIVINPGQNVFSPNDDIIRRISLADDLLGYTVEAFAQDKDGYIWVGTDGGLNRIEKLQSGNFKVDKMNDILGQESIEVNAIEIDNSDNKWIGTSIGVAKISSKNELSVFYNESNSGLISDYILSLKYDEDSQNLWIGTDSGLDKFKTVSSGTKRTKVAHIYPNPFEIWGLNSKVYFTQLKENEPVRIYTFNGEIVNEILPGETEANGAGKAVWDGKNFKDEFVGSGVYFITGTDTAGNFFRDKMVIVRR